MRVNQELAQTKVAPSTRPAPLSTARGPEAGRQLSDERARRRDHEEIGTARRRERGAAPAEVRRHLAQQRAEQVREAEPELTQEAAEHHALAPADVAE